MIFDHARKSLQRLRSPARSAGTIKRLARQAWRVPGLPGKLPYGHTQVDGPNTGPLHGSLDGPNTGHEAWAVREKPHSSNTANITFFIQDLLVSHTTFHSPCRGTGQLLGHSHTVGVGPSTGFVHGSSQGPNTAQSAYAVAENTQNSSEAAINFFFNMTSLVETSITIRVHFCSVTSIYRKLDTRPPCSVKRYPPAPEQARNSKHQAARSRQCDTLSRGPEHRRNTEGGRTRRLPNHPLRVGSRRVFPQVTGAGCNVRRAWPRRSGLRELADRPGLPLRSAAGTKENRRSLAGLVGICTARAGVDRCPGHAHQCGAFRVRRIWRFTSLYSR